MFNGQYIHAGLSEQNRTEQNRHKMIFKMISEDPRTGEDII